MCASCRLSSVQVAIASSHLFELPRDQCARAPANAQLARHGMPVAKRIDYSFDHFARPGPTGEAGLVRETLHGRERRACAVAEESGGDSAAACSRACAMAW